MPSSAEYPFVDAPLLVYVNVIGIGDDMLKEHRERESYARCDPVDVVQASWLA